MRAPTNLLACLLFVWALAGCQVFHTAGKPEPFRHVVKRQQLVLHSDFPLPQQHRLIEELIAQRDLLTSKLRLSTSDEPIHVDLFSEDDAYYDFLELRFPDFPARRAIFVETDVELSVYAHWGDHVAEDLRHEVSHGYLHANDGAAHQLEVVRGGPYLA